MDHKGVSLNIATTNFYDFENRYRILKFSFNHSVLYLAKINIHTTLEMFDRKRTGTINIMEFSELFKYINQWKATFEGIDKDRSGYIEFNELTQGK